jgi:enoyl-CoA hydratase/carnithine racemase
MISIERRGMADWVTLNRPEVLNAMNSRMIDELADYFGSVREPRVIVLRGAGDSFCSGLDLREMAELISRLDVAERMRFQQRLSSIMLAMRRCAQPIICLIHGAASGGGFALAAAADIRYCTPEARLSAPFLKRGLSGCDAAMSYLLPRLVGASIATNLLMTGAVLEAQQALRAGFVSDVVTADRLEAKGEETAIHLLEADLLALELTKQGINLALSASSLEAAVALEDRQQALLAGTESFRERIRAFVERTKR